MVAVTPRHRCALAAIAVAIAAAGASGACSTSPNNSDPATGGASGTDGRSDLLANFADNVVQPTYQQFETVAENLATATGAYASSLSEADLQGAREAWVSAMGVWQRAEMMLVGPAGEMGTTPGGQDVRAEIYSWPTTSPCFVDQEVVAGGFQDPSSFATANVNRRGLDALEYLLYVSTADNDCAPQATINVSGQWAALGDAEVQRRRAEYASVVANQVLDQARSLRAAWSPDGGNFRAELVSAGQGSATYPNLKDAFDAVCSGLLALDTEVKDMKVGAPAGLTCMASPCEVESPFAQNSLQHVRANLVGVQQVFFGGEPDGDAPGFDDLLSSLGSTELATRMSGNLANAISAVDALGQPLSTAVAEDVSTVVALHDAIKLVTDDLKTEFFAVVDCESLDTGPVDND